MRHCKYKGFAKCGVRSAKSEVHAMRVGCGMCDVRCARCEVRTSPYSSPLFVLLHTILKATKPESVNRLLMHIPYPTLHRNEFSKPFPHSKHGGLNTVVTRLHHHGRQSIRLRPKPSSRDTLRTPFRNLNHLACRYHVSPSNVVLHRAYYWRLL